MSVTERRVSDRRRESRSMPNAEPAIPDNPEVMPRQTTSDLWPDMSEVEARFMQIQAEFIEKPRPAVKKAERLVDDAIDRMTKTLHDRMQAIHRETQDDSSTEQLRLTMRTYREFIESLVGRRADRRLASTD